MSENRATLSDGRVLTAHCEQIEVTSMSPRPDPAWTFTDEAGHVHAYNSAAKDYPTLTWVMDEEPYVIVEDGYPEEYPGEGHYECRHCGQPVEPGTIGPSPWREFIPGTWSYTLDGEPITEDEYRSLVEQEIASR